MFVAMFNMGSSVYAVDISFTPLNLTEAAATAAFTNLKTRDALWYQKDYFIYKYNSTLFGIVVIEKNTNNKVLFDHTDDADFDLDRVWVSYHASTLAPATHYRYSISTGAYSTSVSVTTPGSITVSGPAYYSYYTNMKLYQRTYDEEFFPNVIIDVQKQSPYLALGYPNPDWLFVSGVSEEAYWLSMGIDYQQIIADYEAQQANWIRDLVCFVMFNTDPACESGNAVDSPFYDLTFFWEDFASGISGLFIGTIDFFKALVGEGLTAVSGVFANILSFGSSIKTLFGYLPYPIDNIADLGIDISVGLALLKLGRMVFLKV